MSELPLRSEIEPAYKWDLATIYPTDDAWRDAMRAFAEKLQEAARFRGHLGDSPAVLAEWLEQWQALRREFGRLFVYASSQQALDTTDQTAEKAPPPTGKSTTSAAATDNSEAGTSPESGAAGSPAIAPPDPPGEAAKGRE